jgi:hypothetical protein
MGFEGWSMVMTGKKFAQQKTLSYMKHIRTGCDSVAFLCVTL